MNRYALAAREIDARIVELRDRADRWSKHPTLHTRVPGVLAEIARLEPQVSPLYATARWADELYSAKEV